MARLGRAQPFQPKLLKPNWLFASLNVSLTAASATAGVAGFTPKVSKALTGVAATAGIASFTPKLSKALTGVSATAGVAAFVPKVSKALVAVSATAGVAAFIPKVSKTLVAVSATAAAASFTASEAKALTAVSATAAVGSFTPKLSKLLVGVSATAAVASFVTSGRPSLQAVSATAAAASFRASVQRALTGVAASAHAAQITPSVQRAFTGVSATAVAAPFTVPSSGVVGTGAGTLTAITGSAAGLVIPVNVLGGGATRKKRKRKITGVAKAKLAAISGYAEGEVIEPIRVIGRGTLGIVTAEAEAMLVPVGTGAKRLASIGGSASGAVGVKMRSRAVVPMIVGSGRAEHPDPNEDSLILLTLLLAA